MRSRSPANRAGSSVNATQKPARSSRARTEVAGRGSKAAPMTRRGPDLLVLLRGPLAEPALEPRDPAARVQDLLLAGVERVAARADIGADLAVPRGAPGRKCGPAGTGHLGHHVLRVDVGLHIISWFPGRRVASGALASRA